jgi:hypothetical protein
MPSLEELDVPAWNQHCDQGVKCELEFGAGTGSCLFVRVISYLDSFSKLNLIRSLEAMNFHSRVQHT